MTARNPMQRLPMILLLRGRIVEQMVVDRLFGGPILVDLTPIYCLHHALRGLKSKESTLETHDMTYIYTNHGWEDQFEFLPRHCATHTDTTVTFWWNVKFPSPVSSELLWTGDQGLLGIVPLDHKDWPSCTGWIDSEDRHPRVLFVGN